MFVVTSTICTNMSVRSQPEWRNYTLVEDTFKALTARDGAQSIFKTMSVVGWSGSFIPVVCKTRY